MRTDAKKSSKLSFTTSPSLLLLFGVAHKRRVGSSTHFPSLSLYFSLTPQKEEEALAVASAPFRTTHCFLLFLFFPFSCFPSARSSENRKRRRTCLKEKRGRKHAFALLASLLLLLFCKPCSGSMIFPFSPSLTRYLRKLHVHMHSHVWLKALVGKERREDSGLSE